MDKSISKKPMGNDPCDCQWHPLAKVGTIGRFAEDAGKNREAVAGERRAVGAVHDILGFALKLAEEGK